MRPAPSAEPSAVNENEVRADAGPGSALTGQEFASRAEASNGTHVRRSSLNGLFMTGNRHRRFIRLPQRTAEASARARPQSRPSYLGTIFGATVRTSQPIAADWAAGWPAA